MKYAKAYAGAAALVVTFVVGEFGLSLPEEVTGAIALLLTPVVIAIVPNKQPKERPRPLPDSRPYPPRV